MTDPFRYDYLEPGSIRVLKLLSVAPQIRVEFEVVSLDSIPEYNALSYRWVNSSSTDIVLDGKGFQITSSLATCIEHLDAYVGSSIWIDAICINQSDPTEKSHQVHAMSRIYTQAAKVLIWLGPNEEDSDGAMEWINAYGRAAFECGMFNHGRQFFQKWPDVDDDSAQRNTKDKLMELIRSAADAEVDENSTDRRYPRLAFVKLTRRDYFHRVWVKQEVTLARDAVVICGRQTTTIDYFHAALMLYALLRNWEITEWRAGRLTRFPGPFTTEQLIASGDPHGLLQALDPGRACGPLFAGRLNLWRDDLSTLNNLLEQSYVRAGFEGLACEKPIDRIFGLLGIAKDAEELGIVADYLKTPAQVYEMTARALIRQGHVDILKWCRSRRGKAPSWVPDWESRIESSWSEDSGKQIFKATQGMSQPGGDPDAATIMASTICLHGAVIDTVSKVGCVWIADPNLSFDEEACRRMFGEISDFVEESQYSEQERSSATWRIPIGDKELPLNSPYFVRATGRSKDQYTILSAGPLDSDSMQETYSYQTIMGYNAEARPILSGKGYVGLGPSEAEPGDLVVLIWGGTAPYILRPEPAPGGRFLLIGEAFVYGIMDGEMMGHELSDTAFELL